VIAMLILTLTQLKRQVHWSEQRLCRAVGVPYGSFRRWRARLAQGAPARGRPGPKKVVPLSLEELRGAVACLDHGGQRSQGTGALYRQVQAQISRRALAALVTTARRAAAEARQAALCHITWHVPGLVWSLDDTELARSPHQILRLHQVQDLASRYKFRPWVGERIVGETVAERLEQLFRQHGPPLVLKRDNGGNLNQHAVDVVLARYWVVPLNSPRQYPPYNGGMERAVRELKAPLRERLRAGGPLPAAEVQHWAELLAHELNHRPRRSLQGHVACRVFQDARPVLQSYTLRKRREVFDEINALTWTLLQAQGVCTQDEANIIRRVAIEAWLQQHQVITITQNHRVLPVFLQQIAHN
jgi:transposase InsO family protein